METILRFLNARTFAAVGSAVLLVLAIGRYRQFARRRDDERRDAVERASRASRDIDIARELDAQESLKLKALYRQVLAEIAAAKARGEDVDRLRTIADQALAMNAPAQRRAALEALNRLRMAIPRRRSASER